MNELTLRALRNDELMHYGVVGMHWGVRRYQPYSQGYDAKNTGEFVGKIKTTRKGYRKTLDKLSKQESGWDAENKMRTYAGNEYLRRARNAEVKGNVKKEEKYKRKASHRFDEAKRAEAHRDTIRKERDRVIADALRNGYDVVENMRKEQVVPQSQKKLDIAGFIAGSVLYTPVSMLVTRNVVGIPGSAEVYRRSYRLKKQRHDKPELTTMIKADKPYWFGAWYK